MHPHEELEDVATIRRSIATSLDRRLNGVPVKQYRRRMQEQAMTRDEELTQHSADAPGAGLALSRRLFEVRGERS